MKKLILVTLTSLALFGCGDDDDDNNPINDVQEAFEDRDLQNKNFITACIAQPLDAILTGILTGGDASIRAQRVQYRFEGNNVTRTTFLFSEADCTSDVAITFREVGTFNIDPDRRTEDNGRFLDLDYESVHADVNSEAGVEVANSINLCGAADWSIEGAERDVTPQSADMSCYGAQVPRRNANIYRIDEGNILYLGPSTLANVDDASRPTALDMRIKYVAE